jgi:retron-type reverse transcriptase
MTKHYCKIYDSDIAKSFDNISPLAQLQKAKVTIKKI